MVIEDGVTTADDEIYRCARRLARGLQDRGVSAGGTVVFQLPPGLDAVIAFHACWMMGAIAAPIHHRYSTQEVDALLTRLSPSIYFRDGHVMRAAFARQELRTEVNVDPDDIAVILATSGSSGRAKLVRHSHDALAYKGRLMAVVHGLTSDDAALMPAPVAHISGLLSGVLVPGAARMAAIFLRTWSPDLAINLIERNGVTFMVGPPTYFVQMNRSAIFERARLQSLRLISCGGAGVTPEFARQTSVAFDAVVKRTYGSTEAPSVASSHAGDPPELGWTTDGRATGPVELRVDQETGELCVRGRELFRGYLDPSDTAAAIDGGGWFRTGDRAHIKDGWVTILGRLRETIIRGGENIDPHEVEAACEGLEGLHQGVVGPYPDEVMGERVALVFVGERNLTVNEVRDHCGRSGLASFKMPERVLRVSAIPELSMGKPDRQFVRRLLGH